MLQHRVVNYLWEKNRLKLAIVAWVCIADHPFWKCLEQKFNLRSLPITWLLNQINSGILEGAQCSDELHYFSAVIICIPKPEFLKLLSMKICSSVFRVQKRQEMLMGRVRWEVPLACSPIILWGGSGFFFFSIKRKLKNIVLAGIDWDFHLKDWA